MRGFIVLTAVSLSILIVGPGQAPAGSNLLQAQKDRTVAIRLMTLAPTRGFEEVRVGRRTLYVGPPVALSRADVISAELAQTSDGRDITMALSTETTQRLTGSIEDPTDSLLALYLGGRHIAVGKLRLGDGVVAVFALTSSQAQRLTRVLGGDVGDPNMATITVVPSQTVIMPGDVVTADVFVSGAPDVRSYQVKLAIRGGTQGTLVQEEMYLDAQRSDYIFAALDTLSGLDHPGGRIGAVLVDGGVSADEPSYLGTYRLRATENAAGAFEIHATSADGASSIRASTNHPIAFANPTADLTVGEPNDVHWTQDAE